MKMNVYISNHGGKDYEFLNNSPIIDTLYSLVLIAKEEVIRTSEGDEYRLKYVRENMRMELSGRIPGSEQSFTWAGWVDCIRTLSNLTIKNYNVDMNAPHRRQPLDKIISHMEKK